MTTLKKRGKIILNKQKEKVVERNRVGNIKLNRKL